jgi:CCR4-NOT complex subunit CAF16
MGEPVISARQVSFRYAAGLPLALKDLDFELERGSRCLLVGSNGAGKTTLLRIIAGKHLIPPGDLQVLGRPAFYDTALASQVTFLGGKFVVDIDIRVAEMIERAPDKDRCDLLTRILGVDYDWHMHQVSDGQRRRVQLLLGLMRPFDILLLDEITTDLDLIARTDLLVFLEQESKQRDVTILYATHILEKLELWATHIAFIEKGTIVFFSPLDEVNELQKLRARGTPSPLAHMVESWMRP